MKILKSFKFLFLCTTLVAIVQCSKDNTPEETTPTITLNYSSTSFTVDFRSEGNIPAPTVDWEGEKGTFAFMDNIDGLELDPDTGAISWKRNLAAGEQQVIVIAQNSLASVEVTLALESRLGGSFWSGGHNHDSMSDEIDYNRQFWLFEDGTLEVEIIGMADSKGVGVWSLDGNTFNMHFCTYCEDANPQDILTTDEHAYYEGTLTNETLVASISGQWYVIRFDPDSSQLRGNFYLQWD